ncbi:MAG TPA: glycoside hydrolase family 127 protein [Firmicutes bacterium]|nr:glycoside hydrolase family 127 protein [Bacillota bacterium]
MLAVVIAAGAALPVSANDTGTVRAVVQGDLDGSGIVDEADLGLLSQAAASAPAGGQASQEDLAAGDMDGDGGIDYADVRLLYNQLTGSGADIWLPYSLSGLKAWYDAADFTLDDGAKVSVWADKAGGGYDALQPDESKEPAYRQTGSVNSLPGVQFESQTNLKLAESFSLDDMSIFVVMNADTLVNAGDANQMFSKLGLYGDHNWYFNLENGGFNFGWKDDGGGYRNYTGENRTVQPGTSYILGGVKDGSQGAMYMNGAPIGQLPGSIEKPVHNDQPNFIGGGSGNATSLNGTISEILVFDRGLSEEEINSISDYLSEKWGIAVQKPAVQPEGTVSIDGEPFRMFQASNPSYKQVLAPGTTQPPVISADFGPDAQVSIEQAAGLPGRAKITVEQDGSRWEYTIDFSVYDKEITDMQQPEVEQVKVTGGFWKEKLDTIRDVTVDTVFDNFEKSGTLTNFENAGKAGASPSGATDPWNDGLLFETIRGASDFLRSAPDAELEARIDKYIDIVYEASMRSENGYLSTWMMMEHPGQYFDDTGNARLYHDCYNFGCMTEAAVHYYKATGKIKLLYVASRFAEFIADNYGYGQKADGSAKINMVPSHEGPEEMLLKLYTLYRDDPALKAQVEQYNPEYPLSIDEEEYADLVKFWIENRGNYEGRVNGASYGVYAQDHALYYDQTIAAGHAVRANLFYTGMAAAGREFEDYTYLSTADSLWNNIVNKQMYITGGVGATGVDEAYGDNYYLPNDGYCETCAQVAMGFFSEYMSLTFGDAKYADVVENYIYNGVLGCLGEEGNTFFYEQPLTAKNGRWSWRDHTPCCPPMFLKFYSEVPTYIYSYTDDAVYVNQFISSELTLPDGRKVAMESNMPFGGDTSITVEKDTRLYIRLPQWADAEGITIQVNGADADYTVEKGYALLDVQDGDKVDVTFPMEARRIYNDQQVDETEGMVAFGYGPLVYTFEQVDNPGVTNFGVTEFCMGIAPDAVLTAQYEADLLGGVVTLSAPAQYYDYNGNLVDFTAKAVPFYARMNRGACPSYVFVGEEPKAAASSPKNWLAMATSTRNNGNSAAAAFDGNADTCWTAGSQEMPQALMVDLGSLQQVERVQLTFTSAQNWKYQILYSADAEHWEMFADNSGNTENQQTFTETGRAEARYVAVKFHESAGVGYISVTEMAVMGPDSDVNLALGRMCGATSYSNPADSPFAMLDGNEDTRYCPPGVEKPQSITMDMGGKANITGLRILFEKPSDWTYTVEVSDDGEAWETYISETYSMPADGAWREIEKEAAGRYIRFTITGTTGDVWASAWEFDVQTAEEPTNIFEALLAVPGPDDPDNPDNPEIIKGDLNGDERVSIEDVMAACRVLARRNTGAEPNADEIARGDLTGDNKVSIEDIMAICRIIARQKA